MRLDPVHPPLVASLPASAARRASPALASACLALAVTALALTLAASLLVSQVRMGWPVLPLSLALFSPVAALVLWRLEDHPHRRFGPANVVSVARGGMAALIGACLIEVGDLTAGEAHLQWALVGAALFALALDGVDGWLARRTKLASRFGERLDMEVDAYLILILCALAFAGGKAGPYVFAIGLMRYGFIAWGALDPRLAAPLAPSMRRKTVCVLQIALLCAVLVPPVEPPVSHALAILALALLAWSFAVDVRALLRRPQ